MQSGKPHWRSVAGYSFGYDVVFVELLLRVFKVDFPFTPEFVRSLQAVWIDVGVSDDIAIFIDTELPAALIPVTPGVYGPIALHLRVDEKVLNPFIACPGKCIADPGD